jgi:hypothetical protein
MRALLFSIAVLLFISGICAAKQPKPILVRITYNARSSRICFAVYQSGEFYRLSKEGLTLLDPGQDDQQILQGKLSEEQLTQLTALLQKIDFRPQQSSGLVLNGAEWFVADVAQGEKTRRYKWVDADNRDPFPSSVLNLVNWFQKLEIQNSRLISSHELSSLEICPPMNLQPLQPVIAGLQSGSVSCAVR